MGPFNGPTIAILIVLAILLFGAKKLPDLARSLGRSARILKAETKGMVDDNESEENADTRGQAHHQQQDPQQNAPGQPQQGYPQQPQQGYQQPQQPQQQGYPQLPPGQRIVDESGETTHRTYGN